MFNRSIPIAGGREAGLTGHSFADGITAFIEKNSILLFILFSIWFFAANLFLASKKLLWNDELLTYYFSQIPSANQLWLALMTTHEQSPPFFYFVTRAFASLIGFSEISLRLPQMISIWVMFLSIFSFVKRRCFRIYGLLAVLLVYTTSVFYYPFEARPYGMMLGFTGLSLWMWQIAHENQRRSLAIGVLAISNLCLGASHYYGFLGVIPLIVGEFVRTYLRKRVDFPIWISFLFSLMALIIAWPIVQHGKSLSPEFWAVPHWNSILHSYNYLMQPAFSPLLVLIVLIAVYKFKFQRKSGREIQQQTPSYEVTAVFTYFLLPLIGVVIARLGTGAFTERYILIGAIGFGILLTAAIRQLVDLRGAVIIVSFLLLVAFLKPLREYGKYHLERTKLMSTFERFKEPASEGLDVAIADPHLFFQISHYAPKDLKESIIYLADASAAKRYVGTPWVDLTLVEIKDLAQLKVYPYSSYLNSNRSFAAYFTSGRWPWLQQQLMYEGRQVRSIFSDKRTSLVVFSSSKNRILIKK